MSPVENNQGSTRVETMTAIYDAIRERNHQPELTESLQSTVTQCIGSLATWYSRQQPVTEEDAMLVIEMLEVLARDDFDSFFDELADMESGDDLEPLQRLPVLPAVFASEMGSDEEMEAQ